MTIGLTGHQDLGTAKSMDWIRQVLKKSLLQYPNIEMGISALAIGADQLFAEVLLSRSIPYKVIVPCQGYESTFDEGHRGRYFELLEQAQDVEQLAFDQPEEKAFMAAGKAVVDQSDMLMAIWNGLPAKGLGGTGDVVAYAQSKGRKVMHIHTLEQQVMMI